MPGYKIIVGKRGELSIDFIGYQGGECHMSEEKLLNKIKQMKLSKTLEVEETRPEDHMMEVEHQ